MEKRGRTSLSSGVYARALKRGDKMTRKLIDDAVWALGLGLASAQNLLDLEAIVIGGGLGDRLGQPFVDRIAEQMKPHVFAHEAPQVLRTELGDLSGAVGRGRARGRLGLWSHAKAGHVVSPGLTVGHVPSTSAFVGAVIGSSATKRRPGGAKICANRYPSSSSTLRRRWPSSNPSVRLAPTSKRSSKTRLPMGSTSAEQRVRPPVGMPRSSSSSCSRRGSRRRHAALEPSGSRKYGW